MAVVDKRDKSVICTVFSYGKHHDFKVYKESKVRARAETTVEADTGFQGIAALHANSLLPMKRSKKRPLSEEDKQFNRAVSSDRVLVENVICFLKRFKVIAERYRSRRRRFGLRFNLVAGICKFDGLG